MATLPVDRSVTPLRQRVHDDLAMRSMRARTQHDYVRHVCALDRLLRVPPCGDEAEEGLPDVLGRVPQQHDKLGVEGVCRVRRQPVRVLSV